MKLLKLISLLILPTAILAGDLSVQIENIRNSNGKIILEVYDKSDAFMKRTGAYKSFKEIAIKDNQAKVTIALENGTYALSLWHDENSSGAMEFNEYYQPMEGWGVSKNRSGFPAFEDVAIQVSDTNEEQVVNLRYPRKVTFSIEGLRNTEGVLLVGIYNNGQDYLQPGKALTGADNIKIDCKAMKFDFMLLKGSYAASVVHDENKNGELDKNFFGSTKEGFGFSGNAGITAGGPRFSDASFFVGSGDIKEQVIKINY